MLRLNPIKPLALAAVLAALVLAGCGKKGPLYLPDRPRPTKQQPAPAPTTPAPAPPASTP